MKMCADLIQKLNASYLGVFNVFVVIDMAIDKELQILFILM